MKSRFRYFLVAHNKDKHCIISSTRNRGSLWATVDLMEPLAIVQGQPEADGGIRTLVHGKRAPDIRETPSAASVHRASRALMIE